MPKAGLTDMPDLDCFYQMAIDVYTHQALPLTGSPRIANVDALVACNFSEGQRSRTAAVLQYTHIFVVDTSIEIRDSYRGALHALVQLQDYIATPAGQTPVLCQVLFSFITNIPGLGKRRVILADRFIGAAVNSLI
jgi:hypothetical protein